MDPSIYNADYFDRGKQSGLSLYENYRWKPELTIPMVQTMIAHLGITKDHSILDFGCAKGFTVKAFRGLGYRAFGTDVSEWAIANADEEVRDYCFLPQETPKGEKIIDWIIAKDVLEHVPNVQETVDDLMASARVGVFVVVPLSLFDGQPYVVADYEKDVTHIHRLCLSSWAKMFMRPGWTVTGRYMIPGVKDNYAGWEWGNGFLIARRI